MAVQLSGGNPEPPPEKVKGHGRNGADTYIGAQKVKISHPKLKPGDSCPECQKGTVYEIAAPGRLMRLTGQAPLQATVYELQKHANELPLDPDRWRPWNYRNTLQRSDVGFHLDCPLPYFRLGLSPATPDTLAWMSGEMITP